MCKVLPNWNKVAMLKSLSSGTFVLPPPSYPGNIKLQSHCKEIRQFSALSAGKSLFEYLPNDDRSLLRCVLRDNWGQGGGETLFNGFNVPH